MWQQHRTIISGQGCMVHYQNRPSSSAPYHHHIHGLVQERCNSSALAMELCLSYTNPSICSISHKICMWLHCILFCFSDIISFCGSMRTIYLYPSGLLHWHWDNHMIASVPVKQPWRILGEQWIVWKQQKNINCLKQQQNITKCELCASFFIWTIWPSLGAYGAWFITRIALGVVPLTITVLWWLCSYHVPMIWHAHCETEWGIWVKSSAG